MITHVPKDSWGSFQPTVCLFFFLIFRSYPVSGGYRDIISMAVGVVGCVVFIALVVAFVVRRRRRTSKLFWNVLKLLQIVCHIHTDFSQQCCFQKKSVQNSCQQQNSCSLCDCNQPANIKPVIKSNTHNNLCIFRQPAAWWIWIN